MRALGGERFALAGYSMGGRIALHAALALGDRVDRLVLVGASPGIADPAERAARRAAARPCPGMSGAIARRRPRSAAVTGRQLWRVWVKPWRRSSV